MRDAARHPCHRLHRGHSEERSQTAATAALDLPHVASPSLPREPGFERRAGCGFGVAEFETLTAQCAFAAPSTDERIPGEAGSVRRRARRTARHSSKHRCVRERSATCRARAGLACRIFRGVAAAVQRKYRIGGSGSIRLRDQCGKRSRDFGLPRSISLSSARVAGPAAADGARNQIRPRGVGTKRYSDRRCEPHFRQYPVTTFQSIGGARLRPPRWNYTYRKSSSIISTTRRYVYRINE